jgi:ferrochelatase
MSFLPEPDFRHDRASVQPRTAILLTNLGTPDAPEAPALRRYLKQFLSDGRVVEIPRWIWMIILHGIILRVRPAKSAKKYASIWTKDGSPLWVWTQAQARLLQASLSERGVHVSVLPAMRYGQPGIDSQLGALK